LGLLRAIQGLFQGGLAPTLAAALISGGPRGREGALLGLSSSASSIGGAIGPAVGALAMRSMTAGQVFLLPALVMAVVAVALAIVTRAKPAGAPAPAQDPVTGSS